MPITSVETNLELTALVVIADFPVPVERLWDAYADPRQLERMWGPVDFPATFVRHDFAPGGRSQYVMTGPGGEQSRGYWEFLAVDAGHSFEVRDGFANDDGEPNDDLPSMRMQLVFDETEAGSRLTLTTRFGSAAQLQQLLGMGMEEGLRSSMGQIDGVVADADSFAATRPLDQQLLDDRRVRLSRVVAGTPERVWEAHHDTAVMRRWMLEPSGWEMPVCEVAESIGDTYRFEWAPAGGGNGFGSTGELLEQQPPHRAVTTERSLDDDGPGSVNELTLREVSGGTLLTTVIAYPSTEARDRALAGGMPEGMEAGYVRLEQVLRA